MMTEPAPTHWALVAVGCLLLGACDTDQRGTDPAPTVRPLEAPVADAMSEDVAAFMAERWLQFREDLEQAGDDRARARAYADYGLASFGNGLVLPAKAAFLNAVALDPEESRWVYFLALIHQYTGDFAEAARALEQVLRQRPGDVPALLRLVTVRFEQADLDAARRAYEQVLEASPNEAAAHYGLGRIASARGDDRAAVRHYETVLAEQPGADRTHYLLGLAWRNLGEDERARSSLARRGVTEPSFADPLFDAISGGQSRIGGLYTHLTLGSEALIDGDYARAAEEFHLATEDLPNDARAWSGLAKALVRLGQDADAIDAYERALTINPQDAKVLQSMGELQLRLSRHEEAESNLRQALRLDPALADAQVSLAELLLATERGDEAIAAYDAALSIDPNDRDILISRSEALMNLGRTEAALTSLAEAASATPSDAVLRSAYGILLAQAGRSEEATTELRDAIDQAADDTGRARAWYALGRLESSAKNASGALQAFEEALRLDPEHQPTRLTLARTQAGGRRYASAVSTYEDYLARSPDDPQARIEGTMSALLGGRADDALRLLEAGAERENAAPRIRSSLARLLVLTTDPAVRDPERALQLADDALRRSGALNHAETLALCLAAAGRSEEAVDLQQQVLEQATDRASDAQLTRIRQNLQRYRDGGLGRLPLDAG